MDKYKDSNIEELSQVLKTLVRKNSGPGLSTELRELVCTLKSQKLRHSNDAHAFCVSMDNSMRVLLELLKDCEGSADQRDLVLVLGTVGNLCALGCQPRIIVMSDYLEQIVGYLKEYTCSDVLSTVVRVLANLGLDSAHIKTLHSHAVVSQLSQLLTQGDVDLTCKKSVVRALRILCTASESRDELKWSDGVAALVNCMRSEHMDLATSAVQAIEVVSLDGDQEILRTLCDKETMQCVVKFCSHSKTKVKRGAMGILLNSVKVVESRIALSGAGGVEMLVSLMEESSDKNSVVFRKIVYAVCMCCRDVICRQRLRDCGGLARLIAMLVERDYIALHGNIMSALVFYYFDEITLKQMVTKMGLLRTLSYHLQEMSKRVCETAVISDEQTSREMDDSMSSAQNVEGECMNVQQVSDSTSQSCASPRQEEIKSPSTASDSMESINDDCQTDESSGREGPLPSKRMRLADGHREEHTCMSSSTTLLDSLLSSPSPYKSSSCTIRRPLDSPILGDSGSGLEAQVVLMISRISHLRDCLDTLSYPDTLLSILNYFASDGDPNVHIFKVLTRILMNPHCFQNCITCLVPSKILVFLRLNQKFPLTEKVDVDRMPNSKLVTMCQELIEHLSKNAESLYGQGVLEHLLLRGSEKEKQASCLSIPLLCRFPRFCQRLMVDYGAFQVLCDLSKDDQHQLHNMALDTLLTLGHTMLNKMLKKQSHAHFQSCQSIYFPTKFPILDYSFQDLSLTETECCASQIATGQLSQISNHCRFVDTDHFPFDLTIIVHNPTGECLNLQVHRSTLAEESDVFRVMLGGHYKESSSREIHIHSVSLHGFLSLIHFIYGCGWPCRSVRSQVSEMVQIGTGMTSAECSSSDITYEATEQLLSYIMAPYKSKEEADEAECCLRVLVCAGQFLLPELIILCEHAAVNYLLPANIVAMFNFSQLHQCFCLGKNCIRALVILPHSKLRTDICRELLASPEAEAALQIFSCF